MLDQNTDRMWYVIGAVIVGAALIFLVNSSFPQLFASVGDTFINKTDETLEIIDKTGPLKVDGLDNFIFQQGVLYGGVSGSSLTDTVIPSTDTRHWYTPEYIPVDNISSITIELRKDIPTVPTGTRGRVNAYSNEKVFLRTPIDNLTGVTPYTKTYDIASDVSYIRILLLHADKGSYKITLHHKR